MAAEFIPLVSALLIGASIAAGAALWLGLKLRRDLTPPPQLAVEPDPVVDPPILIVE